VNPPDPDPDAIAAALAVHVHEDDFVLPGRSNHIVAATLIPLQWKGGLTAIATVRTSHLRVHPGEVCFPGGTPDSPAEDTRTTAVREAAEELGIVAPRLLGRLSRMPVYTSEHRITPWVAAISDAPLQPAPGEVAEVLRIPILPLLRGSTIEGLPFPMPQGTAWSPLFHAGGHILFGATAHSLLELLDVLAPLYGLQRPPLAKGQTEWSDILPPEWAAGLPT
jgi:8-oxo-dGTP pyrophosphatase MutT (NUDIX family)